MDRLIKNREELAGQRCAEGAGEDADSSRSSPGSRSWKEPPQSAQRLCAWNFALPARVPYDNMEEFLQRTKSKL
ncbi:hypothetical protein KIL84_013289, partial [Mauremys mutica]